jgi:hypothetical protein
MLITAILNMWVKLNIFLYAKSSVGYIVGQYYTNMNVRKNRVRRANIEKISWRCENKLSSGTLRNMFFFSFAVSASPNDFFLKDSHCFFPQRHTRRSSSSSVPVQDPLPTASSSLLSLFLLCSLDRRTSA